MTSDVRSAFNALQPWLDRPENEDSWQQIDTALKKFHALVRSGLTDQPAELVAHIRRKETVFGLVRSLSTERTRLSGTTLEVISSLTRLSTAFQPLLAPYLPPLLRLLSRTNKLYISRTLTTLRAIIRNTRIPEILRYITAEWKAEGGKSASFRIAASEIILDCLGAGKGVVLEREALDRKYVEEIEWVVRIAATDKEVKVRALVKVIWELYQQEWPERVSNFSAPLTPVIRKYLSIGIVAHSTTTTTTSTRTIKKPEIPSILKSHPTSRSTNPLSQSTNTHSHILSLSTTVRPKSNPLSKSVGHSSSHAPPPPPPPPPMPKPRAPPAVATRSIYAPPLPSVVAPIVQRVAAPPLHSATSTPSSSGAFRPQFSTSKAVPLALPINELAKSTSGNSLSHLPPPSSYPPRFLPTTKTTTRPNPSAQNLPILRKAGRAIAPPLPSSSSSISVNSAVGTGGGGGRAIGFKPKLFSASRATRPLANDGGAGTMGGEGVPIGFGAAGPGTIMRAQKTLASAREIIHSHSNSSTKGGKATEMILRVKEEEEVGEEWDGEEGGHVDSQDPPSSIPLPPSIASTPTIPLPPSSIPLPPSSIPLPPSTANTPTKKSKNENLLFSPIMTDARTIAAQYPLPESTKTSPSSIPLPHSLSFPPSSLSFSPSFSFLPTAASTNQRESTITTTTKGTEERGEKKTDFFADLLSLEQESFQTMQVLEPSPSNSPMGHVLLSSSLRGRNGGSEIVVPGSEGVEVLEEEREKDEVEVEKEEEFARFHIPSTIPLPASPVLPSPLLFPTRSIESRNTEEEIDPLKAKEKEETYNSLAEESTVFDVEEDSLLFEEQRPLISPSRLYATHRHPKDGEEDSEEESTFRFDRLRLSGAGVDDDEERGREEEEEEEGMQMQVGGFDEDAPTVILSGPADHLPLLSSLSSYSSESFSALSGGRKEEEEDDVVFRLDDGGKGGMGLRLGSVLGERRSNVL